MRTGTQAGQDGGGRLSFRLLTSFFCLGLALAGCGVVGTVQPTINEGSYLTYDHAFTEAAAQAARTNAEKICAERRRVAVRTDTACSLKNCTTSYQCVDGFEREKLQQKK